MNELYTLLITFLDSAPFQLQAIPISPTGEMCEFHQKELQKLGRKGGRWDVIRDRITRLEAKAIRKELQVEWEVKMVFLNAPSLLPEGVIRKKRGPKPNPNRDKVAKPKEKPWRGVLTVIKPPREPKTRVNTFYEGQYTIRRAKVKFENPSNTTILREKVVFMQPDSNLP